MNSTHYENANFLRELAESLPHLIPSGSADKAALLQRLANEELAQAEYEERARAKVAEARADTRPSMTTDQLRQQLQRRYQEKHDAV
ncbi:plasmid stabilization protein [Pectobacterium versatile]|uniref:plasmid stabilization protein n=1 Tax=Pectobacterium TaxID=122277 RepID=UPI000CD26303|nr:MULTISPECIES: plasmid stabilization protein [Pectobacterium]GKV83667.1 hypothetical protein PEC106664_44410 [Pectobacterium carotovorum subsp. carotovorum]MBA0186279.1 plasmid stabilization protein [Pectobacterium versatile]MBA0190110.1 plasmid stabilization protein [Pectobacterium odoriferum]MBN3097753.1 plasmid stabilization protein [Pectobacterium brasiliense]MBN3104317.1 plasmid stabilization protein [Pectobacterium brasiliense]